MLALQREFMLALQREFGKVRFRSRALEALEPSRMGALEVRRRPSVNFTQNFAFKPCRSLPGGFLDAPGGGGDSWAGPGRSPRYRSDPS